MDIQVVGSLGGIEFCFNVPPDGFDILRFMVLVILDQPDNSRVGQLFRRKRKLQLVPHIVKNIVLKLVQPEMRILIRTQSEGDISLSVVIQKIIKVIEAVADAGFADQLPDGVGEFLVETGGVPGQIPPGQIHHPDQPVFGGNHTGVFPLILQLLLQEIGDGMEFYKAGKLNAVNLIGVFHAPFIISQNPFHIRYRDGIRFQDQTAAEPVECVILMVQLFGAGKLNINSLDISGHMAEQIQFPQRYIVGSGMEDQPGRIISVVENIVADAQRLLPGLGVNENRFFVLGLPESWDRIKGHLPCRKGHAVYSFPSVPARHGGNNLRNMKSPGSPY